MKTKEFNGCKFFYYNEPTQSQITMSCNYLQEKCSSKSKRLIKKQIAVQRNRFVYFDNVAGENVYIKIYINNKPLKVFQDFVRGQRGSRALKTSQKLQSLGIPTYKIILAIEKKSFSFNHPSLILIKECEGKNIKELLQANISPDDKSLLLNKLITIYVKMLKNGVYHNDPNLTNFILHDDELRLIDLDDVTILPTICYNLLIKNLVKFNRILLFAYMRIKNGKINFTGDDRKFIIQSIIKQFDHNLDHNTLFKKIEKKTKIPINEVDKLVKSIM